MTHYIDFMSHYWVVTNSLENLALGHGESPRAWHTYHNTMFFPSYNAQRSGYPLVHVGPTYKTLYSGRAGSRSVLFLTVSQCLVQ